MGVENPAITGFISAVVTFVLLGYWGWSIFYGMFSGKVEPFKFSDKFDIGYIDEPTPVERRTVNKKPKACRVEPVVIERVAPGSSKPKPADHAPNAISVEEAMQWLSENGTKT
jgi:hypothetical protein